jgi:hypothetical protein
MVETSSLSRGVVKQIGSDGTVSVNAPGEACPKPMREGILE